MKHNRKINGFGWSKTIEQYWKTNTFLDFRSFKKTKKKRYQRGLRKSCFWVQNGDMGLPSSTYRLIFDVLLRCQKIIIFGRLPDGPKNRKIEPWSAKGSILSPRGFAKWCIFGQEGPRGRLARADWWRKKQQRSRRAAGARSDTPWADGPANLFHIFYMFYIFYMFI